MKILRAQKSLSNFKIQEFEVRSLRIIPPNDWIVKRSNQFGYNESFEKHGMLWPIAVTEHTHQWVKDRILPKNPQHRDTNGDLIPGYYVHIGNKRVLYAQQNNYDKIEGYLINTKEEKNLIHKSQHIEHTEIPK
jgi:hypothetical protein